MANFTSARIILDYINDASYIGIQFKEIFNLCKSIEAKLLRYQNDTDYKAEVDHLYTLAQRQEINDMVQDVTALRVNWETNHSEALELQQP